MYVLVAMCMYNVFSMYCMCVQLYI
jgi:hypothetical protein